LEAVKQQNDLAKTIPSGSRVIRQAMNNKGLIIRIVGAALLFLLMVTPIIPILYQSVIDKPLYEHDHVFTLKNFSNLFSDARFYAALWNTLILGVIGTVLSTSLGFIAALLLDRLELPFQRTLKIMFLSPIFLSALILSFAWSMMYGPSSFVALWLQGTFGFGLPDLYTLGGISVLAGVSSAPVSYLYFSSAMVNIPNTLEQAARASGATQLQAIRTIVLPLLMPSLLYCLLLNFVLKMDLLAVPLVLGGPARIEVLATYLYDKGILSGKVDYGLVSATAIVMLLLVQGFIFLQKFVLGDKRKYNTVGGRAGRRSLLKTGGWGWLIAIAILAYCLVTSVLPCLYLILRAFTSFLSPYMSIMDVLTLDNFKVVLGYDAYVKSIYNTVIISGVGGAFAVVLTFFGTILAYRSPKFLQDFTEQTAFIPRAIPGLVIGIGIFYATILLPGGGLLQGTLAILVIAYIIRYFPTGFAALSPPFLQIAEDMEKAVRVAGGSQFRSYMAVTLPILRPALLACFLIYFVQFFKEYAAASFLFGPDTAVVGTTMLQLNVMGNYGPVAALSAITIALTLPVAIFIYGKRTA
jgi:iron(III) transport system permease protein